MSRFPALVGIEGRAVPVLQWSVRKWEFSKSQNAFEYEMLRALRRCVPYRQPDVSPFERPLTEREVTDFAARFRDCSVRAFCLPFVNITEALPPLRRYVHPAYRLDGALLKRAPVLKPYTGVRVLQVTK